MNGFELWQLFAVVEYQNQYESLRQESPRDCCVVVADDKEVLVQADAPFWFKNTIGGFFSDDVYSI